MAGECVTEFSQLMNCIVFIRVRVNLQGDCFRMNSREVAILEAHEFDVGAFCPESFLAHVSCTPNPRRI